jgi:hypothetical protein
MKMILWSAATGGFYRRDLHRADTIPADAVEITAARHRELLEAQSAGAPIVPGADGRPTTRRPRSRVAELRDRAVRAAKREAGRRILAIAPLWRQANDNAAIALAALQLTAGGATVDFLPAVERRRAVDRVRAASNALEMAIGAMTRAELAVFNPAAEVHWS